MDHCQRCGTCCRKGGPAIHREDKPLLENGHIPLGTLFTIRKYEPAYDNVQGHIFPAPSDIIRVKSRDSSTVCVFFNHNNNSCKIYEKRPLECRTLKCWDTFGIEQIYNKERLSREDLLKNIHHLHDLIDYHQNRCDYRQIRKLINQLNQGGNQIATDTIREILAFDEHFRSLILEKGLCEFDIMDFLLGRPLLKTFPSLGLKVIRKKDGYRLMPATAFV